MKGTERVGIIMELQLLLIYFSFYLVYLCFFQEPETAHWFSLVLIPCMILFLWRRDKSTDRSFSRIMRDAGIQKRFRLRGMAAAVILGGLFCVMQLFFSFNRVKMQLILASPGGVKKAVAAFFLVFITAGFTEEFFMRGILQTRLQIIFRKSWQAILGSALLFTVYHLPYAYFSPRWPSYHNFPDAFSLSAMQALPIGIICGALYRYSRNNLLACVIFHSLVDLFPVIVILAEN